jgi:hypothetical protein
MVNLQQIMAVEFPYMLVEGEKQAKMEARRGWGGRGRSVDVVYYRLYYNVHITVDNSSHVQKVGEVLPSLSF